MSWKRKTIDAACGLAKRVARNAHSAPLKPRSIFVLRNNDIGDLLAITPLFAALRRTFPEARVVAGVGSWNLDVLLNNPNVDSVLRINAPWHNGKIRSRGFASAMRYILCDEEVKALQRENCDIGIDVLGSPQGSLLLMRAHIPWRLGVRGYAGGDSAAHQCVKFDPSEHVGRAALRFAELLGATDLPENRPQIFLQAPALNHGAIVVSPSGGFAEKCWPIANFARLLDRLASRRIMVLGGQNDRAAGARLAAGRAHVEDCTGRYSLRETFAAIAGSRAVICNSSMAMHAAAAFRKPSLVLLGSHFQDAEQHRAQWAWPETRVLGRTLAHPGIWTPDEAWPMLADLLSAP